MVPKLRRRLPRPDAKKDTQINIRITAIEKRNLEIMSRNDLRGTSDFVRRLLNREWKRLRKKEGQANIDAMIDNWNDGDFD